MASSLCDFLQRCKGLIDGGSEFIGVVGNEASDLDSICSSMLLSFYWTLERGELYVPLVGGGLLTLFKDRLLVLGMRFEVLAVLREFGIEALDDLIFLSQVNLDRCTSLVLVDHNSIDVRWLAHPILASIPVSAIIDHHEITTDTLPSSQVPGEYIIESCASCMSLLVTRIITLKTLPEDLSRLALTVISWDSMDFEYRFLEPDKRACSLINMQLPSHLTFKSLRALKGDGITDPRLLLQYDSKAFRLFDESFYCISVVHEPISGELVVEAEELAAVLDVKYLFIMAAFFTDPLEPVKSLQIHIYIPKAIREQLCPSLLAIIKDIQANSDIAGVYCIGDSLRTKFGRKQLQPILHGLLSSLN